jgi:hypothetical protein
MPANFDEIADYHNSMAARYAARARAARDRGDITTACYYAELIAPHLQAAQEQRVAMRQTPGRPMENQTPRRWPPEPPPVSLAASGLLAVLRGAGHVAAAIRQSISRRNPPFNGLSLH